MYLFFSVVFVLCQVLSLFINHLLRGGTTCNFLLETFLFPIKSVDYHFKSLIVIEMFEIFGFGPLESSKSAQRAVTVHTNAEVFTPNQNVKVGSQQAVYTLKPHQLKIC